MTRTKTAPAPAPVTRTREKSLADPGVATTAATATPHLDRAIDETMRLGPRGFECGSLRDVEKLARMYLDSGFAPRDMDTIAKLVVAIELGTLLGLTPLQAVQNICVINNRPTIWGDGLLAIILASPEYGGHEEWIDKTDPKDPVAHCRFVRRLNRGGETTNQSVERTFRWSEACKAGLTTDPKRFPWKQYPQRMLQMRARAFAARDAFAHLLKGIQCREEVEDYRANERSAAAAGAANIGSTPANGNGKGPLYAAMEERLGDRTQSPADDAPWPDAGNVDPSGEGVDPPAPEPSNEPTWNYEAFRLALSVCRTLQEVEAIDLATCGPDSALTDEQRKVAAQLICDARAKLTAAAKRQREPGEEG